MNQPSPESPEEAEHRGALMQMLLRHFTPNAELISSAEYEDGSLAKYEATVVVGNSGERLPTALLSDVSASTGSVIWIGRGLDQLPVDSQSRLGFSFDGNEPRAEARQVEYRDKRHSVRLAEYLPVTIADGGIEILASYLEPSDSIPYVMRSGRFWFVNGLPAQFFDYPSDADVPLLVFADLLHDFFRTEVGRDNPAVIRLEDVSVHVDPTRIEAAAEYLSSERVPFVLGVIPAQRFQDGSVVALRERPGLVQALRTAQERGGTIALHGYHHTFGSGEDYEFWDDQRNAPLAGETWELYANKVEDGIRILRDQGLDPRLWETPHYAGSALAYRVFAHYFSHAIENREPISWLPYPAGPDPAGQILIPENIGYLNLEQGLTVEDQLERARRLLIVRDAWAVGFYHPVSVELAELDRLVRGLRELGYRFADIGALPLQVNYDYQPSPMARLGNLLSVDRELLIRSIDRSLDARFAWWQTVRDFPWIPILLGAYLLIFFLRLTEQWRPPRHAARSILDTTGRPHRRANPIRLLAVLLAGGLVLTGGAWAVSEVSRTPGTTLLGSLTPSDDWEIFVYYTVVERFYSGPPEQVEGCPRYDCGTDTEVLGSFPADFLHAVRFNGTGRITSQPGPAKYLNYSAEAGPGFGYWIDDTPRDDRGLALIPWVSAAADASVPFGTRLGIVDCGADAETGTPVSRPICARFQAAEWIVRDRYEPGFVVPNGIDLYIGEQDRPNFDVEAPFVIHSRGARIAASTPDG